MRVTNTMLVSNYLSGLNQNMSKLSAFQAQIASNRRITKLSDDPVGVIKSLAVRSRLANREQYNRNIDDARAWLTQSETAIMDMNDVLKSAYEKTVAAASGTLSASEKAAIAVDIRQLRDHALQIGNSSIGGKYIFGGYNTTTPPFSESGGAALYQGTDLLTADAGQIAALGSQVIEYEIGTSITTEISITGVSLMGTGDDNLIGLLDQLTQVLAGGGSPGGISPFITRLQQKQEDILSLAADIGGRTGRLDLVANRYGQDTINDETVKANIEDIDLAETVMRLKMAETVYNAALSAGSGVIQLSLANFLK